MFRHLKTALHLAILPGLILPAMALAQPQEERSFRIGADQFAGGEFVTYTESDTEDLFAAAERVVMDGAVTGSVFAGGRRVDIRGTVADDVFAAGVDVALSGDVAGDAAVIGYDVAVRGAIGGDLRAAGTTVRVSSTVAGYALLAGETVEINGPIAGDAAVTARRIIWGPDARIEGLLTLHEPEGRSSVVPDGVADRIERKIFEEFDEDEFRVEERVESGVRGGILSGALIVTALAALFGMVAPDSARTAVALSHSRPWSTLGTGFVTQSAATGAGLVLAMTVIGFFLLPALMVAAGLLAFAGHIVGTWCLGARIVEALTRGEILSLAQRVIAAVAGAVAGAILLFIPVIGWIAVLGILLFGVGAIATQVLERRRAG